MLFGLFRSNMASSKKPRSTYQISCKMFFFHIINCAYTLCLYHFKIFEIFQSPNVFLVQIQLTLIGMFWITFLCAQKITLYDKWHNILHYLVGNYLTKIQPITISDRYYSRKHNLPPKVSPSPSSVLKS